MQPIEYRQERKSLISSLRKLLKPYLWASGYRHGNGSLLIWVPSDSKGKPLRDKIFKLKGGFVAQEFQGFTRDGLILDTFAGALVQKPFDELPMEDLFRLNLWATRYFGKLGQPAR